MTYDFREARILDMTRDRALSLLGFPPGASPSEEDGKKARRDKLRQAHPDLGGTTEAMQDINRAYDFLFPKGGTRNLQEDDDDFSDVAPVRQQPQWQPPKPVRVTFDQAKAEAGIPGDVEWQFVTDRQRDKQSYSGDESSFSRNAFVAYGKTSTKHIFAVAIHYTRKDYYIGGSNDTDAWLVQSFHHPIKDDEGSNPAWLYKQVVTALKFARGEFAFGGRFNSKVIDARGTWKLDEKLPLGSEVSIKHWLVNSGSVAEDAPAVAGRKQVVELEVSSSSYGEPPPGHYAIPKGKSRLWFPDGTYHGSWYQFTLIVNGKQIVLGEDDTGKLLSVRLRGKDIVSAIYGDYVYSKAKKLLTRAKAGKVVMVWMSENLHGLPEAARVILKAAADQMK